MLLILRIISVIVVACIVSHQTSYASENSTNQMLINEISHDNGENNLLNQTCKEFLFIDRVFYFENTNEFYLYLDFDYGESIEEFYLKLSIMIDTVLYRSELNGWSRNLILSNKSKKYFNLSCLNILTIYDENNDILSKISLSHVEYYDHSIDGGFIAVYDPFEGDDIVYDYEYIYAISNELHKNSYKVFNNVVSDILNKLLIDNLNIDIEHLWNIKHIVSKHNEDYYSIISFYDKIHKNVSYLTFTTPDSFDVLMKLTDEVHISDILPTIAEYNDKPIFILELGIPETDNIFNKIAVYENGKYAIIDSKTITKKKSSEYLDE